MTLRSKVNLKTRRMLWALFAVPLLLGLVACTGIPVTSLPRLYSLQGQILDIQPSDFMLAIQMDERMAPPASAVPVMHLAIKPQEPGAFEAVDKKLPMQWASQTPKSLGLQAADKGRRWLVFDFPAASQAELTRLQIQFKSVQAQRKGKSGGSISVGIAQDGVAVNAPALAGTRWESWLQTSKAQGFFELWSGTVASLLKAASDAKAKEAAAVR